MEYYFDDLLSLIIYIIIYVISAGLLLLRKKICWGTKKIQWVVIVIAIVIPVLFAAFRYNVGTDYRTYAAMMNSYKSISLTDYLKNADFIGGTPIGIVLLCNISQGNRLVFFGLLALLAYAPIMVFLYYNHGEFSCETLALTIFVYLTGTFSTSLNIAKQGIAIGFVALSLWFVRERKPIRFLLCIFAAFLFHQTALVFIPVYFIWSYKNQISTIRKWMVIIACVLVIFLLDYILQFLGSDWANYAGSTNGTMNLSMLIYIFWSVVYLFFSKDLIKLNSINELYILLYIVGAMFQVIGFWSIYGKRISLYFVITGIWLSSQLPLCERLKKNKSFVTFLLIIYNIALFALTRYILKQGGIIPYGIML